MLRKIKEFFNICFKKIENIALISNLDFDLSHKKVAFLKPGFKKHPK
jgi:hypothetical protein